jgi:hypothetical protein
VIDDAANCSVFPVATVTDVMLPCRYRSAVPAESQISIPTIAAPPRFPPDAVHDTELLFVDTPPDGVPNALDPSDEPPVVYPLPDASVPFAVFDPVAVIRRSLNGGVTVNADPPDVPGVIVKLVLLE